MSILTVELIWLLFAAWKAPAWVREIGLLVLVTDLIWQLKGMFNAAEVVQQVGDVPLTLVAGGLKVSFISLIYALLIYAASLVIRMLQKPRIWAEDGSRASGPVLRPFRFLNGSRPVIKRARFNRCRAVSAACRTPRRSVRAGSRTAPECGWRCAW